MKFDEAMDHLKDGKKVTRELWKETVYFRMVDKSVKSFQPQLTHYVYNEDIMVSDGWIASINGNNKIQKEYKFCDIISLLQQGYKAKLKEWEDMFIYLDKGSNSLILHSMDSFPFLPDFESFTAQDWMTLE